MSITVGIKRPQLARLLGGRAGEPAVLRGDRRRAARSSCSTAGSRCAPACPPNATSRPPSASAVRPSPPPMTRSARRAIVESRQGAGSWTALPAGRRGRPARARRPADAHRPGPRARRRAARVRRVRRRGRRGLPRRTAARATNRSGWPGCGRRSPSATPRAACRPCPSRSSSPPARSTACASCSRRSSTRRRGPGRVAHLPARARRPAPRGARLVPRRRQRGLGPRAHRRRHAPGRRPARVRDPRLPEPHRPPDGRRRPRRARGRAAGDAGAYVVSGRDLRRARRSTTSPAPRPLAAHDTDGRVISIGSAAKVLWGGLRIGWIRAGQAARTPPGRGAGDRRPGQPGARTARSSPSCCDRIETITAERRTVLRERRAALVAALRDECPDWEFEVPPGGLSLWVRLPGGSARHWRPRPDGTACTSSRGRRSASTGSWTTT